MFYLKKIINGRMNVPEPEYLTVGSDEVTEGQALVLSFGTLGKAGPTVKPMYVAMANCAASGVCPVMKVAPNMVFETTASGAVTIGAKYTLGANADSITNTTTSGIATVVGVYTDPSVVHVIFE